MNITKAELAQNLSDKFKLSKQDAKDLVDNFFTQIIEALAHGEELKITGFGSFALRDKKSRPGRNPRTGEAVVISERRVVTFKQGQKLKEHVAEEAESIVGA
ncbi:MAG TPA: integration host factor subunit alpha [Gammaproteobacteria bacterium]|nr:integration host factor subunit alpha [Gammaproteobacteria bacterium]